MIRKEIKNENTNYQYQLIKGTSIQSLEIIFQNKHFMNNSIKNA